MPSYLLGLIGSNIGASMSPLLHETEATRLGVQLCYRLIDFQRTGLRIPDLGDLLRWAEHFGFNGFNVTHPYKGAILPLLDTLSADAAAIGAANTVVLKDGKRHGHNTDWFGFAESLQRALPAADLRCVALIGAGGAGAATAYAVLRRGAARLQVFDIDAERTRALCARLSTQFSTARIEVTNSAAAALAGATGAILATPVGMAAHPGTPFDPALLQPHLWVADVIYAPLETELLAAARRLGCRTMNGGGMLSFQAAAAFELFTGLQPDAERMLECFALHAGYARKA